MKLSVRVRWWGVLVALLVAPSCLARPSLLDSVSESWRPVAGHRVNRPLFRSNGEGDRESKSQEVVTEAEMGRAQATSPTPIGESLRMVTKQLLNSPEATDMVATDIRTPPKIKIQAPSEEFVSLGKGEAVPLEADNIHSYQVVTNTQYIKPANAVESTPASGISTWVLLNNGEQSTQASQKKPSKPAQAITSQTSTKKKVPKPTTQEATKNTPENVKNATGVKLENRQAAVITKVDNPKKTQQSVNQEPLVKIPALMLQDAKFKNKTPVVVGRVPSSASSKNKSETTTVFKKGNATITPVTVEKDETLAPQTIRRKVVTSNPITTFSTTPSAKPTFQYELVPTTSVVVHTDIVESETTEDAGTTELPTTTPKRTRKPGTKKKKKNKNRRRRPSKKPDGVVESKITEESNSTRIAANGSRPLSTRIYNYLSREIMPSVGVGIVGLMLTAGLAGLFLYPFGGGVAARRTYEKVPAPSSDNHMYYYNDYSSNGEVDNGQPEESVFGQVLAGMQQAGNKYDKYTRPSGSASGTQTHYSSQSKYRYDPSHEYGYQSASSYQGKDKYSSVSDPVGRNPEGYSTLPDSAKYSSYSSIAGSSQYTAPSGSSVITQYGDTKYPSLSASSDTVYGNSKYSPSADSNSDVGNTQYDSSSMDSTNLDHSGSKYSTLTGISVEPQSSKYSSMTNDESIKYSQSSKYTSLTDDQASKYHQNPKYTSITEGQNEKYTSLTDNESTKYTSLTDGQNTKYGSVKDDTFGKYPTSAEYTAYSNPADIGTQSGTYTSTNHKQAIYTDIEYDDTKSLPSLTEEDKSDKSQPSFSALHASDDSYLGADSMSMFSGSYNNEVRHRQGVLAVEHGPRSMKLDRQKRQLDENLNEVDGSLPEDQTTEKSESTSEYMTEKTTDEPKTSPSPSHESTVESTTWSMPKDPEFTTPAPTRDQGFFGFLGKLVQMKLRMGLELLRSTTHAMARYLDTVQKRMETVVKGMDQKTSRQRRNIFNHILN